MKQVFRVIQTALFAARWLLLPFYLAMIAVLGMLVVFFVLEVIHSVPGLLRMTEDDLIILTLSLIDLSLSANLVVLVIQTGYQNYIVPVTDAESFDQTEAVKQISFSALKQKLLSSITVIAAVHLLGSFLQVDTQDNRTLEWQMGIVFTFAIIGLFFAFTDRINHANH